VFLVNQGSISPRDSLVECKGDKGRDTWNNPVKSLLVADLSHPSNLIWTIDAKTKQIAEIDSKILDQLSPRNEDMRIALSMSGMGFISASTIPTEIGDLRDFSSPDKLAAYCRLVPSVYQSAGKLMAVSKAWFASYQEHDHRSSMPLF
jgi:hypothetical protein